MRSASSRRAWPRAAVTSRRGRPPESAPPVAASFTCRRRVGEQRRAAAVRRRRRHRPCPRRARARSPRRRSRLSPRQGRAGEGPALATKKQDFNAAIQAFARRSPRTSSDARALAERALPAPDQRATAARRTTISTRRSRGMAIPSCAPQIWFNLGLLRDRAGDAEAACGSLMPTRTCSSPRRRRAASSPADRRAPWRSARLTSRAPMLVKGWTELLARIGAAEEAHRRGDERGRGARAPVQARLEVGGQPVRRRCRRGSSSRLHDVRAPQQPCGLPREAGRVPGRERRSFRGLARALPWDTQRERARSRGCSWSRAPSTAAGAVYDGEVNDEMRCSGRRELPRADVRTRAPAGRCVALRWPAGSEADVKVQGGQLVVSGAAAATSEFGSPRQHQRQRQRHATSTNRPTRCAARGRLLLSLLAHGA